VVALEQIARRFFEDHPDARDDVVKAHFAFAALRVDPQAHDFGVGWNGDYATAKAQRCAWCGRSRWDVRFDALPGPCRKRPLDMPGFVAGVIEREERLFASTQAKADKIVPRVVRERGMSPETLRFLYETHGLDEETVRAAV
jgi:hypothetical protein